MQHQGNIQDIREQQKNKRQRTTFTREQLDSLECCFRLQQYLVGADRVKLADKLELTETQVKVWYQNRRIKWRRHQESFQQQQRPLTGIGK